MFDADRLIDLLGALEQFVESSQTAMGSLGSMDGEEVVGQVRHVY